MLSPINGNLNGLKEIGLFVGTREIFLPDCRLLRAKIKDSNTQCVYKEYPEMIHDWWLFPVNNRMEVIKDLGTFLKA